ncbi:MAG: helix-turn-helix domain-containing protein [Actinomycetota bacterium]|nr:helix-turn-helix domain-containing protein [Actinomycetota bacterium]
MEERHLSLGEVAEVLDKNERTIRRWIKSGKLRAYKPGRDYLIPESAIGELLEGSEVYPKDLQASLPLEAAVEHAASKAVAASTSLVDWLRERCGHAYLALPKAELEEMFDRLSEDAPERRELALAVNREYNTFCKFPNNVTTAERVAMRRMIRTAIPEVAVKHGIALMEGGLDREYQEEAARIFEVERATEESATA